MDLLAIKKDVFGDTELPKDWSTALIECISSLEPKMRTIFYLKYSETNPMTFKMIADVLDMGMPKFRTFKSKAERSIRSGMGKFIKYGDVHYKPPKQEPKHGLDADIKTLNVSARTYNRIKRYGCTIGDIVELMVRCSINDTVKLKGVGVSGTKELYEAIMSIDSIQPETMSIIKSQYYVAKKRFDSYCRCRDKENSDFIDKFKGRICL